MNEIWLPTSSKKLTHTLFNKINLQLSIKNYHKINNFKQSYIFKIFLANYFVLK